jgi:thymidylate synthase
VVNEALNYGYTLLPGAVPDDPEAALVAVSAAIPRFRDNHLRKLIADWMDRQVQVRLNPFGSGLSRNSWNSDDLHPDLAGLQEGGAYSYTYPERNVGMVETLAQQLYTDASSRRAFWPIFQPNDAFRAADLTRIPCTIGYQALIREVPAVGSQLHLTSLMRSMDYTRFWVTDIWMAYKLQKCLLDYLRPKPAAGLGQLSQLILSFHMFNEEGLEIY